MKKYFLQLFADANTQTSNTLSAEMKTYYDTELLDNARPALIHSQVCDKKPLPAGNGKSIEFRKFNTFAPATTPLTEGVTPDGSSAGVTTVTATVGQYGDYVTVSDVLKLHAVDDVVMGIAGEMGFAGGETEDILTRDELQSGTHVIYAPNGSTAVTSRYGLSADCKITGKLVAQAATQLKKMNAPTFDGKYLCIIHPSVAYDLRNDDGWTAAHQYAAPTELFTGEIGELHGVRFLETTEAKIYRGADLASDSRTLTASASASNSNTVSFDGGTVVADALIGRYVLIGNARYKVTDNTTSQLTLDAKVTCDDNTVIYPGEGGAAGCAVYGTLFCGKGCAATIDPEGAGMQMIVKPLGSGGTADPLDQRSTIGYKLSHAALIQHEERMVRLECGSSLYSGTDTAN